ncbi:MAG: hypothetical protein OEV93_00605 [Candidatus Moranbacteria bacterium]|nr:hypothetical protein [Candidatus Moranbacteria bacterium]
MKQISAPVAWAIIIGTTLVIAGIILVENKKFSYSSFVSDGYLENQDEGLVEYLENQNEGLVEYSDKRSEEINRSSNGKNERLRECGLVKKICSNGTVFEEVNEDCEFPECPNEKIPNWEEWYVVGSGKMKFTFKTPSGWRCFEEDVFHETNCDANASGHPSGKDAIIHYRGVSIDRRLKEIEDSETKKYEELKKIKIGNYNAYSFIEVYTKSGERNYYVLVDFDDGYVSFHLVKKSSGEELSEEEKTIISSLNKEYKR